MIRNRVKAALKEGKIVVGVTILEWGRPSIAKMMSIAGFDFLFLEQEHTFMDEETMANIFLAARDADIPAIVKVPSLHRHFISRALDAGALGIQLPRTETKADVERLIQYMKFPPLGDRAASPGLANTDYQAMTLEDFFRCSNEETLAIAHIETVKGLENLEEIVSHPEVDVVFVGPMDLSTSLGLPGQVTHPKVVSAIAEVIDKARERGIAPGIYAGDFQTGKMWIEKGMQLIETMSDVEMLIEKGSELMGQFRSFIEAGKR